MMTYEEFKDAAIEAMNERFGEGYTVECLSCGDGDDTLSVYSEKADVSVADSVRMHYNFYLGGRSLDDIFGNLGDMFYAELN